MSSTLRCLNQKVKLLNEIENVNFEKYLEILKVRYIRKKNGRNHYMGMR